MRSAALVVDVTKLEAVEVTGVMLILLARVDGKNSDLAAAAVVIATLVKLGALLKTI